jgi:hypothetical protein
MDQEQTYKNLKAFRDAVVKQARTNLTKSGKNASGKLYRSIGGTVKAMPNSIGMYFEMEEYGAYQDKGVNGKRSAWTTAYKFGTKMPPPSKLDKWIVRRGIAPRDAQGKLMPRKTLQFLIARSIYINGIKPSLFFTKAVNSAYKKLPDELIKSYGLDVNKIVNQALTETIDKAKKK